MKPPPFEYDAPASVEEALALLAEHGADAKVLAGGQSLVPLLNFRLARPARLVDLNNLGELSGLRRSGGDLHIGAMTRQSMLERSETVASHWPLLRQAIDFVAHAQIRNRGTVGGSLAHADPAAELPVVLAALDGSVVVRSLRGERVIRCDELLIEVRIPALAERTGAAFTEYARRHGDFALGGAAVTVTADPSGVCERAVIALLAAAPTPLRATEAERVLTGRRIDADAAREAAAEAVRDLKPTGDIHGSSAYRQRLIESMVRRAVIAAAERASTEKVAA
jgi:carbon-monoxide dehydrogenase medium subunit/6-hydroxypseudooxynicotine dehydrogenase subunit alpha